MSAAEISVKVEFNKAGAAELRKLADVIEKTAPKRGRPKKDKDEDEDTDESDDEDTSDDDESGDDDDGGDDGDSDDEDSGDDDDASDDDDEEEKKPAKGKKLSLEKDILPAFQAYAKKHGRPKAAAILKKFKVKSVRELPPAKFAEALKLVKLKKAA